MSEFAGADADADADAVLPLLCGSEEPGQGRRAALQAALRAAVREGRLTPGTRLPSSRALAAQLGLARGTVTAGYEQLVAEGYLTTRAGAATLVARLPGATRHEPAAPSPSPQPNPPPASASYRHDLSPGRPDAAAFPLALWQRAARRVLAQVEPADLADADPRGHPRLRTALAGYLARTRGVHTDPAALVVTCGFRHTLALLADVLQRGGAHAVALEDPCVPDHREVFRRRNLRTLPLPVDAHGARTGVPEPAAAAVVTPAHQAVLGAVLAPERRAGLVGWAAERGRLLVEDDREGEFRYDREPLGALQGLAPEHVAYVGSTSPTLAPGVRLGWVALPRGWRELCVAAKGGAGGRPGVLGQLVLAELLFRQDYDRHVRAQRQHYRRRREALVRGLAGEAPRVRVHGASAGTQLLLELPAAGPTEDEVCAAAARRGLRLTGARAYWHAAAPERPAGIVVGYGAPGEREFPEALDQLVSVLGELL